MSRAVDTIDYLLKDRGVTFPQDSNVVEQYKYRMLQAQAFAATNNQRAVGFGLGYESSEASSEAWAADYQEARRYGLAKQIGHLLSDGEWSLPEESQHPKNGEELTELQGLAIGQFLLSTGATLPCTEQDMRAVREERERTFTSAEQAEFMGGASETELRASDEAYFQIRERTTLIGTIIGTSQADFALQNV